MYLKRIEAYDKTGPRINSVITLNPKALEQARALDKERKAKGPRSQLHGIPVMICEYLPGRTLDKYSEWHTRARDIVDSLFHILHEMHGITNLTFGALGAGPQYPTWPDYLDDRHLATRTPRTFVRSNAFSNTRGHGSQSCVRD
jgi:hypothetical protein